MDDIEVISSAKIDIPDLSAHARQKLKDIQEQLIQMSRKDRSSPFVYGRLLVAARDVIQDEGYEKETVVQFAKRLEIEERDYYRYTKLFLIWEPYEPFLKNIGVKIQRHFCNENNYDEQLLKEVVTIARSREILYGEFAEKMLPPEKDKPKKVPARKAKEPEAKEEEVIDVTPVMAIEAPQPPVKLSIATRRELEDTRKEIIRQATDDLADLVKKLDSFTTNHQIRRGEWFRKVEDGISCLLSGMKKWTHIEPA